MYRNNIMQKFVFIILMSSIIFVGAKADIPTSQQHEVEHLLDFIKSSACHMNRNGDVASGEVAQQHIKLKYDHFRSKIKTTEEFIKLAATKSTMSGKYYTVDCDGNNSILVKDWLRNELQRYRAQQ